MEKYKKQLSDGDWRSGDRAPFSFRGGWEDHLCHWAWTIRACVRSALLGFVINCVIWVKWFCFFGSWFLIITWMINLIIRQQRKLLKILCKRIWDLRIYIDVNSEGYIGEKKKKHKLSWIYFCEESVLYWAAWSAQPVCWLLIETLVAYTQWSWCSKSLGKIQRKESKVLGI